MEQKSLSTSLATACVLGGTARAAQASTACNREYRRGKVSELLSPAEEGGDQLRARDARHSEGVAAHR
jgi:hypothetical protein